MLIDLIRHGEPVGGSRYRGHSIDDPLSEKGWHQMRDAIGDEAPWDLIITSPLIRCSAFAEEIANRHNIRVAIEPQLREIGFGAWEGKTKEALRTERPHEFEAFYQNPVVNTPENAEPVPDFYQRISLVIDRLAESDTNHLLIVAHAGVIRAAITHAIGASLSSMYRINVTNGGISRLRKTAQGFILDQLNGNL